MKKTIMLLTFVFAVAMTNYGQDKTATINLGGTYQEASFNDADTITENRTLYTVQFNAAQNYPTTQDFLIAMDSIDAPEMAVQLQGSKFGDSYSSIGSAVNWVGTTGDTTIVISNATANRYRIYRAVVTRTAGEAKVTVAALKLFYE
jgi:hypothetical protein